MPRGGQILLSGRYLLDSAGRLHRWRPRSCVDTVAIVTVRARRARMKPVPVEIRGPSIDEIALVLPDPELATSGHSNDEQGGGVVGAPELGGPGGLAAPGEAPAANESPPAPMVDFPGVGTIPDPVWSAPAAAPRPRHTPPPKISLKGAPSGMEQAAERWRSS